MRKNNNFISSVERRKLIKNVGEHQKNIPFLSSSKNIKKVSFSLFIVCIKKLICTCTSHKIKTQWRRKIRKIYFFLNISMQLQGTTNIIKFFSPSLISSFLIAAMTFKRIFSFVLFNFEEKKVKRWISWNKN